MKSGGEDAVVFGDELCGRQKALWSSANGELELADREMTVKAGKCENEYSC